jgi:glycyl-tRNA synthetase beta chain
MVRARALQAIVDERQPWLERAKLVARRLSGISKEAKPHFHPKDAFSCAKKDDGAIVKLVQDAHEKTRDLSDVGKVRAALEYAAELATRLDEIFVATLINDPDDADTPKRLELLSYGAQCMLRIADFSRLA